MKDQKKISSPKSVVSLLVMATLLLCNSLVWAQNAKILVYFKTGPYYHKSIPAGIAALRKLGTENKFDVDTTTDYKKFTTENLKQYATIVFMSPTGKGVFKDSLNKDAFKEYIHNGGGFLGVHSATDFEYDWAWYGKLVGAYFLGHPANNIQKATLHVIDKKTPSTKNLPDTISRTDEYYSFRPGTVASDLHFLIKLDEKTLNYGRQENLKMGDFHPLAWYHDFEGGRAFYTALGHTDETFSDPLILDHLRGALQYTMGKKYKGKKQ